MRYDLVLAADAVRSDATFDTKRDRIVGIPRIDKHPYTRSDVYIFNLSVFPSLAQYFTKKVPLCDVRFERSPCPRFPPSPGRISLTSPLSTRLRLRIELRRKPVNVFLLDMTYDLLSLPRDVRDMSEAGVGEFTYMFSVYEGGQQDTFSVLWRNADWWRLRWSMRDVALGCEVTRPTERVRPIRPTIWFYPIFIRIQSSHKE
ncbi:hypothetical protein F5146DRAFT_1145787 [Armillaria mellea]|nr:hypothetical protein F5146DRAFT_1145787 [Armillaria mellea]